jgi:membrane associated rhomboid family serine protease
MVYVAGARGVWQRPGTPGSGRETRLQHFQSIFGGARGLDQPFRGDLERLLFCDLPLLIRWGITILGRMSDPSESPETQIPRSAEDAAEASPPRERAFNLPAVVLAAIIACIAIHLLRAYALTVEHNIDVIVRGAFIPIRYTGGYELDVFAFTSPITYSLLHGGWAHLAVNMIWLAAFGSPLATRLGVWRFILFWIVTSIAAASLHFALHPYDEAPLVGASGAISGMMGAAARFAFRIDRSDTLPSFAGPVLPIGLVLRLRGVLIFLGLWMAVNVATGVFTLVPNMEDSIAWEAHIGGFMVGFLGIGLFDRRSQHRVQEREPEA